LTNLHYLYLGNKSLKDLEPLAGLVNLQRLDLQSMSGLEAEVSMLKGGHCRSLEIRRT